MSSTTKYLATLTLFVSLAFCGQARAISVAVFPVDDLSQDHNAISNEMNGFVANQVYAKGLEVVPYEKIMSYITARRIRQLGFLDTLEIMHTRNVLGADLLLFASVCQQNQKAGTLGMTLSLVRTSDGKTVWASSKGVSLINEQRILGLNSPTSFDDLLPILARKLFADWPADLDFTAGRELAGEQIAAVKETAYIQVESIFFTPKFVKPGDEVNCTIRFKNGEDAADKAKVFIKVGNRVHLASSEDGIYYKAAWVGSERNPEEQVQVASTGNDSLILKGVWTGEAKDADYPVSLILDWPSGKREESYLGSYVVDSIAPEASLKLQGKVIDGVVTFRKQLPVSVRFKRNEPIKKWEFKVADATGLEILTERGSSEVPETIIWGGQTKRNLRADSGFYSITLKLWDRAGNSSEVTEKVLLLDRLPEVEVKVEQGAAGIIATLVPKDQVPVTSWRLELWSENHILLTTAAGDTLPAKVRFGNLADNIDKDKIACILSVRDSLGSRSKKEISKLLSHLSTSREDENVAAEADQAGEWQADF